jgi:hypothetical protein
MSGQSPPNLQGPGPGPGIKHDIIVIEHDKLNDIPLSFDVDENYSSNSCSSQTAAAETESTTRASVSIATEPQHSVTQSVRSTKSSTVIESGPGDHLIQSQNLTQTIVAVSETESKINCKTMSWNSSHNSPPGLGPGSGSAPRSESDTHLVSTSESDAADFVSDLRPDTQYHIERIIRNNHQTNLKPTTSELENTETHQNLNVHQPPADADVRAIRLWDLHSNDLFESSLLELVQMLVQLDESDSDAISCSEENGCDDLPPTFTVSTMQVMIQ